jgi:hypothetical protein
LGPGEEKMSSKISRDRNLGIKMKRSLALFSSVSFTLSRHYKRRIGTRPK